MIDKMNKKELQERIYELENALINCKTSNPSTIVHSNNYIRKDRKIKTFSGRHSSAISIDDWIDELELVFSAGKLSNAEKVDLIYSHSKDGRKTK